MGERALFVYGTLMSATRLAAVTGRSFPARAAVLEGFERRQPAGLAHPYVVPHAGARVEGLLLEGLDEAALAALDRYEDEGGLYHRRGIEVRTDGAPVQCDVYVGDEAALIRAARAPVRTRRPASRG